MVNSSVNWTVITGSTGGIGTEIAKILASRGDNLILINRSKNKANAQYEELRSYHPNLSIELVTADFMDMTSIAKAIEQVLKIPGRVNVLYNNAGVLSSDYTLSAQGFESHFAVNTLAPYQFIKGLWNSMKRPLDEPPGLILNLSSDVINRQKTLELNSLKSPSAVTGLMGTYAQSKLAVTMLSAALADELKSDNILIRAVDPGATKSPMTMDNSAMPKLLKWLAPLLFRPADKQAAKVVLSASPSAFSSGTGIFLANGKEKDLPKAARDASAQRDLIKLLDRYIGVLV